MALAPTRMSHRALETSARLLRLPGVRALVRSSFLEYIHLRALHEVQLQGLPVWRPEMRPSAPSDPPGDSP
jgi:hypothetical protein